MLTLIVAASRLDILLWNRQIHNNVKLIATLKGEILAILTDDQQLAGAFDRFAAVSQDNATFHKTI